MHRRAPRTFATILIGLLLGGLSTLWSAGVSPAGRAGGTPVRGKFLKMMLRYDLSPVFLPCQKGELVERHRTCGSR